MSCRSPAGSERGRLPPPLFGDQRQDRWGGSHQCGLPHCACVRLSEAPLSQLASAKVKDFARRKTDRRSNAMEVKRLKVSGADGGVWSQEACGKPRTSPRNLSATKCVILQKLFLFFFSNLLVWLSHQSEGKQLLSHCVCLFVFATYRKVNGVCRVNIFLSSSFVCDICDYAQLQTVMFAFSSCSFGLHPEKTLY